MPTRKKPLLVTADVLALLNKQIQQVGSQARWCAANEVSTAYLSDVLNKRREPGKKILDALGLEAITFYIPKKDHP